MEYSNYLLSPINEEAAAELRKRGGTIHVADEHPGYPCRQCLLDAQVGEELLLVSHDPFVTESEYRSASPIFLHRSPCAPSLAAGELPRQLTQRQLSVRSFDADEMMIDAAVIDGARLDDTIARFFADEDSHRIHVHNATRGCWAVTIDRR